MDQDGKILSRDLIGAVADSECRNWVCGICFPSGQLGHIWGNLVENLVADWLRKLRFFAALCRSVPGISPLSSIKTTLSPKLAVRRSGVRSPSAPPNNLKYINHLTTPNFWTLSDYCLSLSFFSRRGLRA